MRAVLITAMVVVTVSSLMAQTVPARPAASESGPAKAATLMTPAQFQALPSKPADARVFYGTDVNQFGELRIPSGAGPHPVAILIHGGCWKAEYSNLKDLAPMADALKAKGIATWNIEYRRLGQAGAGWPGTYLDVGHAVDQLRTIAVANHLDLGHVVLVGHSAGGHLAMWAAARSRLPKSSPLYVRDPLPIRGVVDLAGVADMEAYLPYERLCQGAVVEQLLGGTPAEVPEHYAQASAIKMLPLGTPQTLIWGRSDVFFPIPLGELYTRAAKHAGDPVRQVTIEEAGHFEIASPLSAAWTTVETEISSLLNRSTSP
jgi:acetyl esterase/lipase